LADSFDSVERIRTDFLPTAVAEHDGSGLLARCRRAMRSYPVSTRFNPQDLSQMPSPRIAPAVEAGYHHNPIVLHLEEYAIWEGPHSRPPTVPMHDR